MITLDAYSELIKNTRSYPVVHPEVPVYPALGLSGEAGEVAEKFKKILRDKDQTISEEDRVLILKELGDVVWYVGAIALELDSDLAEVIQINFTKLMDRKIRGEIHGEGDER